MTTSIRSDASGTFGALQHNGVDSVTFDATGILPGSYKDGSIVDTDLALSANSAPVKTALNATGGAPIFACRAWVNFNGTGTVAIRASGNVSSITDNGTGNYTVNFTTAMPDANFAVCASSGFNNTVDVSITSAEVLAQTASSVHIITFGPSSGNLFDSLNCHVAIFR